VLFGGRLLDGDALQALCIHPLEQNSSAKAQGMGSPSDANRLGAIAASRSLGGGGGNRPRPTTPPADPPA
jgi:hypothetical protein